MNDISTPINKTLADAFLVEIQSPRHMRDWIETYIGIRFPDTYIDPASNSSPIEAMYRAYADYRDDKCLQTPGYIWMSGRDLGKTLCGSILNVLLMVHFKASIAHFAAIKPQSEKCLQYVSGFIRKITPYLEYHGRSVIGSAKSKIQIENEDKTVSYITVIVANMAGGNSEHCPVVSFDELEVLSAEGLKGYKEAKLIATRFKNKGPLVIKYSTRKFAGGIFEKEIQNAKNTGEIVLSWNIVDMTEKCLPERYKPDQPKIKRYIAKELPLRQITPDEFAMLSDKDRLDYDAIDAYAGCVTCPLLPVCRTRLADRPVEDTGGFFKSIDHTIRQFKITDAETAMAQLLCWKPSTQGMVYPRFLPKDDGTGNTLTMKQAWESFTGTDAPRNLSLPNLIKKMLDSGVRFHCGLDWGYRNCYSIVVGAKLANGEMWLLDTYAISGLEWDAQLALAKQVRDIYKPAKWFCDTAYPGSIKTFSKNGMPCGKFTKDISAGINAVRTQIVDASDRRKLKVVIHERNNLMLKMFAENCFKMDALGNIIFEERETDVVDIGDATRYLFQNLFAPKREGMKHNIDTNIYASMDTSTETFESWQEQKLKAARQEDQLQDSKGLSHDGNLFWDFGGLDKTDDDLSDRPNIIEEAEEIEKLKGQ
jgi:hypothetical protein